MPDFSGPRGHGSGLDSIGFYAALTAALIIAGAAAFPINRWLISGGKGHAVVHQHHAHRAVRAPVSRPHVVLA